jgi:hypothetical protein
VARTNLSGSRTSVINIPSFAGQNTALTFSEIDITESPKMLNLLPNSIGGLANRPGTIPESTLTVGEIKTLCNLRKGSSNTILATVGNKLYKFASGTFTAQGGTLTSANIDSAQFKDANSNEVLIIADGGDLKYYDGTAVTNITPAANDESPLPANDLANINTHKPTGCLVHNTRVVLWNGSDTIWHSKIGYYDYFRQVDYQRFVRENDTVQTCVTYRGALLVFMRRHVAVLFGHDVEDWVQDFLDTTDGCIAPKTVQTVIFPNGQQEVFYLSDNGVHSVYGIDTLEQDSSARYSTKSMTAKKIDWDGLGVTKAEWEKAVAGFYNGQYWLIYKKGTTYHGLVFDTNTGEWYPVKNVKADSFYKDEEKILLGASDGHIRKFDADLYSDWDDQAKTSGTFIEKIWYSKMMTPKLTGFDHFWDVLMVEARQFPVKSSLDVEVNTYRNQYSRPSALKTAVFIWGETQWGESQWANEKLTDLLNNAKRLRTFVKGQYAQIKLYNNRDEPIEIYGVRYEVRSMDTYY